MSQVGPVVTSIVSSVVSPVSGGDGSFNSSMHVPYVLNAQGLLGIAINDALYGVTRNSDATAIDTNGIIVDLGPHEVAGDGDEIVRNLFNGLDITDVSNWTTGGATLTYSASTGWFRLQNISLTSEVIPPIALSGMSIEGGIFLGSFEAYNADATNSGIRLLVKRHSGGSFSGSDIDSALTSDSSDSPDILTSGTFTGVASNTGVAYIFSSAGTATPSDDFYFRFPTIQPVTLKPNQNPVLPSDIQVDTAEGSELATNNNALGAVGHNIDSTSGIASSGSFDVYQAQSLIVPTGFPFALEVESTQANSYFSVDIGDDFNLIENKKYIVGTWNRHTGVSTGTWAQRFSANSNLGSPFTTIGGVDAARLEYVYEETLMTYDPAVNRYWGYRESNATDDGGIYSAGLTVREASTGLYKSNRRVSNTVSDGTVADGPELFINGTPNGTTDNWTPVSEASLAIVDGKLEVTNGVGGYDAASQGVATTVGQKYPLSVDVTTGTAGKYTILTSPNSDMSSATPLDSGNTSGTKTPTFTATAILTYFAFGTNDATTGETVSFSNMSVKHASTGIITPVTGPLLRKQVSKSIADSQPLQLQGRYATPTNSEILPIPSNRVKLGGDRRYEMVSKAAYFDGVSGSFLSSVDSVAASITDDGTWIAYITADDQTPAGDLICIGKYDITGNNRSWAVYLKTTGALQLTTSPDGSTVVNSSSTAAAETINGKSVWIRVAFDNSANTSNFYTSDDPASTDPLAVDWTQLGTADISHVSAGIYDSDALVTIGAREDDGSSNRFEGSVSKAYVIASTDPTATPALSFDANDHVTGDSYVDSGVGADLVTNITTDAGSSYVDGVLTLVQASGTEYAQTDAPVVNGESFILEYTVDSNTLAGTNNLYYADSSSLNYIALSHTIGNHSVEIVPAFTDNLRFIIRGESPGVEIVMSGISVEKGTRWTLNGSADTVKPATTLSTFATDTLSTTEGETIANGGCLLDVNYHTVKGLLGESFEAEALNTYSDDFSNAAWVKGRVDLVSNDRLAPNGTMTADKITSNDINESTVQQTIAITSAAITNTSFFVRAGTATFCHLLAFDGSANGARVWFNLTTGAVGTDAAFGTGWSYLSGSGKIEPSVDGWYRVSASFVTVGTAYLSRISPSNSDGATGSAIGLSLHIWRGNFVEGSVVSSSIYTAAAAVTRAAEVFTQSLLNFDNAAGTAYLVWRPSVAQAAWTDQVGLISVRNNTASVLNITGAGKIQSSDGSTNPGSTGLNWLADEDVCSTVSWRASDGSWLIKSTSPQGTMQASGTYDGNFVLGDFLSVIYGGNIGYNLLDLVVVKAYTTTDYTVLDV